MAKNLCYIFKISKNGTGKISGLKACGGMIWRFRQGGLAGSDVPKESIRTSMGFEERIEEFTGVQQGWVNALCLRKSHGDMRTVWQACKTGQVVMELHQQFYSHV